MASTTKRGKQALLQWVKNVTSEYSSVSPPDNLHKSFADGHLFLALVHHFSAAATDPSLSFDFDEKSMGLSREDRLTFAFEQMEKLGVPVLLDADDVPESSPDEMTIVTQLSTMYKHFNPQTAEQGGKKGKKNKKNKKKKQQQQRQEKEEEEKESNTEKQDTPAQMEEVENVVAEDQSSAVDAAIVNDDAEPGMEVAGQKEGDVEEGGDALDQQQQQQQDGEIEGETLEVEKPEEGGDDGTHQDQEAVTTEHGVEEVLHQEQPSDEDGAVDSQDVLQQQEKEEEEEKKLDAVQEGATHGEEEEGNVIECSLDGKEMEEGSIEKENIEDDVQEQSNDDEQFVDVQVEQDEPESEPEPQLTEEEMLLQEREELRRQFSHSDTEAAFSMENGDDDEVIDEDVGAADDSQLADEYVHHESEAIQDMASQLRSEMEHFDRELELEHEAIEEEEEEKAEEGKHSKMDADLMDDDMSFEQSRREGMIKYQERVAVSQEEQIRLEDLLDEAQDRIEELEAQLNQVDRIKNRYKEQYTKAFAESQALEREGISQRHSLHEMERELLHQKNLREDIKVRMDDMKRKYEFEINQLESKAHEDAKSVKALERRETQISDELRRQDGKMDELLEQCKTLEQERLKFENENRELMLERDRLVIQMRMEAQLKEQAVGDNDNLHQFLEELSRNKRTLQQQLQDAQMDAEMLKSELDDANQELRKLRQIKLNDERDLTELRATIVKESSTKIDYETSIMQMRHEIKELRSQLEVEQRQNMLISRAKFTSDDQLDATQKQLEEREVEIVELQRRLRRQEKEISRAADKAQAESKRVLELNKVERSLQEEIFQLKEQVAAADWKLQNEIKQRAEQEKKIRDLELRLRFK